MLASECLYKKSLVERAQLGLGELEETSPRGPQNASQTMPWISAGEGRQVQHVQAPSAKTDCRGLGRMLRAWVCVRERAGGPGVWVGVGEGLSVVTKDLKHLQLVLR